MLKQVFEEVLAHRRNIAIERIAIEELGQEVIQQPKLNRMVAEHLPQRRQLGLLVPGVHVLRQFDAIMAFQTCEVGGESYFVHLQVFRDCRVASCLAAFSRESEEGKRL
ncbi:hypothetical protein D9M68_956060 [compost metagenome]